MKKILCLLLFGALFAACTSDEEETAPFVSEIEMPPLSERFAPGDEVTVRAQGFEAGDEIMFDIRWPMSGGTLDVGYARGIWGIVTQQTATSVSFLAPGHYPASTVEVLLRRAGRMQSLGKISVLDGQSPAQAALYGILHSDAGYTSIERLDAETGTPTEVAQLVGFDALFGVVNAPGTNRIFGLSKREAGNLGVFYDLTMRYWRDSDPEEYLMAGRLYDEAAYLRSDGERVALTKMSMTRMSPAVTPQWTLPDGLTPDRLAGAPFLMDAEGNLLLAADNGDGTYSPVVLPSQLGVYRVVVGDPVRASALIPFYLIRSMDTDGRKENKLFGGYVLSAVDGGGSELRSFDPHTLSFGEPFATLPLPVRSVAVDFDGGGQQIYCLLTDERGKGSIRVYDTVEKNWRSFPDRDYPYSEIVLAR